jgi:phosphoribosylformylglycinamidine synthase
MWQFTEVVEGMSEACEALGIPVIGGNVSFYNESRGTDIDPTPVVGVLGLIDELDAAPPVPRLVSGQRVVVLGETRTELGGSEWAAIVHGLAGGAPPAADLDTARGLHELVREVVAGALVDGVHDCSDGGLAVALAEMAIGGGCGFDLAIPEANDGVADAAWCFGESASRVVLSVASELVDDVLALAHRRGVAAADLGAAGGTVLRLAGAAGPVLEVALEDATRAWRDAIPAALGVVGAGPPGSTTSS